MNNIVVIPNSLGNLNQLLKKEIKGIIIPIKNLSVGNSFYLEITDLELIIKNNYNKEIFVSLNKSMENKDLSFLKEVLIILSKLDIKGILFYDMAVLNMAKEINLKKELVIYQDHLNASICSHNFYKKYLNTSFITSDITINEINEIKDKTKMKIMYQVYGYLSIFNSRRYLVSNFFEYIKKEKNNNLYYLKNNDDYYPILEESSGTIIYPKKEINLLNELNNLSNIDYLVLNGFNISEDIFNKVIDDFINRNNYDNQDNYLGFYNQKTIYKVKNNDE